MDLFEAVVLSELMGRAGPRGVLLAPDGQPLDPVDQRRLVAPSVLAARVKTRHRALGDDLVDARHRAERHLEKSAQLGHTALTYAGPAYPRSLAQIADPPPVLWLRGQLGVLQRPAVALIGSRTGSEYACQVATDLGAELSARGVVVVSGLARGVDAAAHRGGLKGAAGTVAVLGCGLDVVYPPEHADLARAIVAAGALLSEYGPSTPPHRFHFPRRNRLISGLSMAVVVIEATARSGSLITARCAAEQGRDVMAVPGNVLTGRNIGGHALIKDGAKVVETADDILDEMGLDLGKHATRGRRGLISHDSLLRHMDAGESYDLDDLTAVSGLNGAELLARLVELELEGQVARSASGRFSRLRG